MDGAAVAGISAREREVLAALGEHLTNAEIGARLFISIRTVESHVSSLLRKLRATDRRALAALAVVAPRAADAPATTGPMTSVAVLPSPLTPFVGRAAERSALTDALTRHRLVTAVGPGGVGKTRLALAVAADLAGRPGPPPGQPASSGQKPAGQFPDGVWYVDLVPVTDPPMIAPAVADALGLGERRTGSPTDSILDWASTRECLLILDNCEHLLDGVVVLLERLLAGSPGLAVLATSRARLLVPFEWVFTVPGLSIESGDGGPGDAVELFLGRAAAGGRALTAQDQLRIGAVCRGLDGMALAIELAAARFASLGLDGLEAGLADRLRLLTGGRRMDDRHRSLRSTLDWSYALLADSDQAVLRRISVFAGPFTPAAAGHVLAGWPPVPAEEVPTVLAGLADQSLLITVAEPGGTRYQALETIRQYGVEQLRGSAESLEARARHLDWCRGVGEGLEHAPDQLAGAWRAAFDQVAGELRSALGWAADDVRYRDQAFELALGLARLSFVRGLPGEAQRRYEQAAELAVDDRTAAEALRGAAGAAESRHFGTDALRLRRRAADAALRAGDRSGAAGDLARNAELVSRAPGLMAERTAPGAAAALIAEAQAMAGDDPTVQARLLSAQAFAGAVADPETLDLVERTIEVARRLGEPLIECAVLDQLTAIELAQGEVGAAAASSLRRIELLGPVPITATTALEFFDAHIMAAECAIAAGDLPGARIMAERLRDLPFHREEAHLASSRLLVVTVLAGDFAEAADLSERYLEGWQRAGRPRAGNLSRGAYAAATMYGLRGDDRARADWLDVVAALSSSGVPVSDIHFGEFFDALLLLHRGRPDEALRLLSSAPEDFREWYNGLWRPWYAAVWAEAAVLTGPVDAGARLERARRATAGNPIATAMVERSAAWAGDDRNGLAAAAAALQAAGCRYQWARTLIMLGGDERRQGEATLAAMGATAMAWP